MTRDIRWGDLHNVRDLGGLPRLADGGPSETRFGRIYRSGRLDSLDVSGWGDVVAAGVGHVIDLRNPSEVRELAPRPEQIAKVALPVEDENDAEFMAEWGGRLGTPDYYPIAVGRWPQFFSDVFTAIATSPRGGVIVHCSAGRDRTGLISALLLEEAGVERTAILDDYEAAARATNDRLRSHPVAHESPLDETRFAARINASRRALSGFLDSFPSSASEPLRASLRHAASRLL